MRALEPAQGDAQGHARISRQLGLRDAERSSLPRAASPSEEPWTATHPHRGSIRSTNSPRSTCAAAGAASAPPPPSTPRDTPSTPRRILELFPALELIEGLKPTPEDHAGLSGDAAAARAGRRRRPPAAAGRLHPAPRARPRRHGHRLRSRARVAQEPGGAQGHAPAVPCRPGLPAAVSDRGPLGGEAAPHQHRAGLRLRRAGRRLLLRDAMHRRRRPGAGARRRPPPPGRGQPRHRGRDRRRGTGDGDRRGCGPAARPSPAAC